MLLQLFQPSAGDGVHSTRVKSSHMSYFSGDLFSGPNLNPFFDRSARRNCCSRGGCNLEQHTIRRFLSGPWSWCGIWSSRMWIFSTRRVVVVLTLIADLQFLSWRDSIIPLFERGDLTSWAEPIESGIYIVLWKLDFNGKEINISKMIFCPFLFDTKPLFHYAYSLNQIRTIIFVWKYYLWWHQDKHFIAVRTLNIIWGRFC